MWRISDDFWDTWPLLLEQFTRLRNWAPYRAPGAWPDADMLPLGTLEMGKRTTRLTPDEQTTLMTLWCIARSPLIMGGDLRKLDAATAALLTNDEVLAVNQASSGNTELFNADGIAAWQAHAPNGDRYLALFNLRDETAGPVSVPLASLGLHGVVRPRDLWRQADLPVVTTIFAADIPCHGAGLFRLAPV
jgi:hypothetical protein